MSKLDKLKLASASNTIKSKLVNAGAKIDGGDNLTSFGGIIESQMSADSTKALVIFSLRSTKIGTVADVIGSVPTVLSAIAKKVSFAAYVKYRNYIGTLRSVDQPDEIRTIFHFTLPIDNLGTTQCVDLELIGYQAKVIEPENPSILSFSYCNELFDVRTAEWNTVYIISDLNAADSMYGTQWMRIIKNGVENWQYVGPDLSRYITVNMLAETLEDYVRCESLSNDVSSLIAKDELVITTLQCQIAEFLKNSDTVNSALDTAISTLVSDNSTDIYTAVYNLINTLLGSDSTISNTLDSSISALIENESSTLYSTLLSFLTENEYATHSEVNEAFEDEISSDTVTEFWDSVFSDSGDSE